MQTLTAVGGEIVKFSPRERSIVRLLLRGRENKEVAHELGISAHTVKANLTRIYRALGIHSNMELCAWVLSHPLSLAGYAVSRATHPEGCGCGSPYCSAFSLIDRAA